LLKYFLYIYITLPLLALSQTAQPYYYSLPNQNGLVSTTIYSILQSKKGAIYIGHENGLTRYNGKTYKQLPFLGKGKSISNLVEDDNGRIWARTFYGDILYIENDSVYEHAYSKIDKAGLVTIATANKQIYFFDNNGIKINSPYKKNELPNTIAIDKNNNACIFDICEANGNGLFISMYDGTGNYVKMLKNNVAIQSHYLGKFTGKVYFLKMQGKIYLYALSVNKLYLYKNNSWTLSNVQLISNPDEAKLTGCSVIYDSLFCIYSFNGIKLFNSKGQQTHHFLIGSQVSSVYVDAETNMWVGTLQEGIYIFPSIAIKNINLKKILHEKDNVYSSVAINDSTLLLGTYSGKLLWLNTNGTLIDSLNLGRKSEVQSLFYGKTSNKIYAFCDGIFTVNSVSKKIEKYAYVNSTKNILVLNDTLYCAASGGFIRLTNNSEKEILLNTWVNNLQYEASKNCFWLATKNGLYCYTKTKNICKKITDTSLANCGIKNVQLHANNKLYVLAINKGVLLQNPNGTIKLIIPNKNIENIKLIGDTLYLIYKQCVIFYDVNSQKEVYILNKTKALNTEATLTIFKLKNYFYTVSQKNIQVFEKLILPNYQIPQVFVKDIKGTFFLNNKMLQSAFLKNSIEFKIEVLPNISSKGTYKIMYRLKEIDETFTIKENSLDDFYFKYQLLPAGNYMFEVIAVNEDGVKSKPLLLNFKISYPFWQKWWFIAVIIILAALLLLQIYKWRIGLIKKSALEKIEKERTKIQLLSAELTAIRSQMNPHFIFNSLSSIQAKVLSEDRKGAYKDISTFSKLMRSVLNFSGKEFIKLNDEIEFIKDYLYLESVRVDGKINYKINIDEKLDIHFLEIPTLITQPFIENAIKHGLLHKKGEKNLEVAFTFQNSELSIGIKDNGIGREKSMKINERVSSTHESFATNAMQKRIARINQGNKVVVYLNTIDHHNGTEVIIKINYDR
jgi:hypothetical protein